MGTHMLGQGVTAKFNANPPQNLNSSKCLPVYIPPVAYGICCNHTL